MGELHGFLIVGPTASGKSDAAQWLAESTGVDVLSADSMLVYRGMDVGTAKPTSDERRRVHYHGVDLVDPCVDFSVWDYREHVLGSLRERRRAVGSAWAPVLVAGGTGLYVKALLEGLRRVPGADEELRRHWTAVWREQGVGPLREALRAVRPDLLAGLSDPENPRRLIRALEVAQGGGHEPEPPPVRRAEPAGPLAGLQVEPEELNRRIELRARRMYAEGLIEEVRRLQRDWPDGLSRTAGQAIGYAEAAAVLAGTMREDEAIRRTALRSRQLAKRQRTWFRHQARVVWVQVTARMGPEEVGREVQNVWRQHGPTPIVE